MVKSIRFNEEKNQVLIATRGISFEDIIKALSDGYLLGDISNSSKKHPMQKVYIVKINQYAYAVPYVFDSQRNEVFLKTIYPSRILTKIYLRGDKNEKNK